jgi:hypothetical protein
MMMRDTTTWWWELQQNGGHNYETVRTIIIWWRGPQHDACILQHDGLLLWVEDGGMAATWWPKQFICVRDILNPSLHLKQQQDEGQFWDMESLEAHYGPEWPARLLSQFKWVGGGVNVPYAWYSHAMLTWDSLCGPQQSTNQDRIPAAWGLESSV